ncbi:hypothetical protein GCM10027199_44330 [Amycolatopsis magusensis]
MWLITVRSNGYGTNFTFTFGMLPRRGKGSSVCGACHECGFRDVRRLESHIRDRAGRLRAGEFHIRDVEPHILDAGVFGRANVELACASVEFGCLSVGFRCLNVGFGCASVQLACVNVGFGCVSVQLGGVGVGLGGGGLD